MRKEGEKASKEVGHRRLTCVPGWTLRKEGMIHTGYIISTDEKDVQLIGVGQRF